MSNDPLGDVPEFYQPDDMNRLIRNLGEAGWLEGNQFVDGEVFSIHYSKKGVERMRATIPAMKRLAPSMFGGKQPSKPSLVNTLIFAAEIIVIAPELMGKINSSAEGDALMVLIASYATKHGGELP